jgi:hypothetical protein
MPDEYYPAITPSFFMELVSPSTNFTAHPGALYRPTENSVLNCTLVDASSCATQVIYVSVFNSTVTFYTTNSQTLSGYASGALSTTGFWTGTFQFFSDGANYTMLPSPDQVVYNHIVCNQNGNPTLSVGAAAGTGASIAFASGRPSSDVAGQIALTTGTSTTTGTLATVTFYVQYYSNPLVVLFPASSGTATLAPYIYTFVGGTTSFTINTNTALPTNSTFYWTYHVYG